MQQSAYEELENALMLNANQFAEKYLSQDSEEKQNLDNSNNSKMKQSKS